ncbi:MAG: tetratricopeptide repeat protein [Terracidiphilus sp.]
MPKLLRGESDSRSRSQFSGHSLAWKLAAGKILLLLALLGAAPGTHAATQDNVSSQLEKADAFHRQSDTTHSIPILRRVLEQSPRNYTANLLLGEDLLHSGDFTSAIAPLKRACDLRPQDPVAEVYLADAAAAKGDFPLATEALLAGLIRSNSSERFLEAWASYSLERFRILERSLRTTRQGEAVALRVEAASRPEGSKDRESLLQESATAYPEQRGIWGELGSAQLELQMSSEAAQSLQQAETREPEGTETLQLEALVAGLEGDTEEAAKRLTMLAARSPAELQAGLALLRIALPPGSRLRGIALECLRNPLSCRLVSLPPPNPTQRPAGNLYADGRWEPLVAMREPATPAGPEWLWRGVAFAKTGHCRQAVPPLERGLVSDNLVAGFWLEICYSGEAGRSVERLRAEQDQAAYHRLHADLLMRLQGNPAAARPEYDEALKTSPEDPLLLERLAEAYLATGDTEHARTAAQAALAVDPHRVEALRTLSAAAMSERDYDQALPSLRRLAVETPQDAFVAAQLGTALAGTGNYPEALDWLAQSLAHGYPDEKGALHASLGRVLRKVGREAEAVKAESEARRLSDACQSRMSGSSQDGPNAHQ